VQEANAYERLAAFCNSEASGTYFIKFGIRVSTLQGIEEIKF